MALEDRLPVGCLPKSTKCLVLQDGTPLDKAIKELREGLSDKNDSDTQCEAETTVETVTEANIGNISTAGIRNTSTVPTPISINVKPGASSTQVSYDLSGAVASCNCKNTSPKITFTDPNGARICTNTNLSGSERLRPDQIPSTFEAEIICNKESGQEVLSYSGKLSNTSRTAHLQSTSLSSSGPLEDQSQVNEHFDSCISRVKSQVEALNNVSHNGVTGIANIVCDLETQIEAIQSADSLDTIVTCNGVDVNIKDLVCDLNQRQANLEAQNEALASEVERLNSQYNTLYTLLTK